MASCAYTTAHGLPDHATRLAATLFRYFDFGGYYGDALAVHSHALRAARMMASPAAEAEALTNLGGVHWRQSCHRQALEHLELALVLVQDARDRAREAIVQTHLGIVYWHLSRYVPAAEHLRKGLEAFSDLGDKTGAAVSLSCLGLVLWRQGHYNEAADHGQRALALFHEVGDRFGAARALAGRPWGRVPAAG